MLRRFENLARFDVMINRGRSGPIPMWRVYVAGFVIAVVGTTVVSAAWHAEHDAGPNCVVCKLRHEPLADLAEISRSVLAMRPSRRRVRFSPRGSRRTRTLASPPVPRRSSSASTRYQRSSNTTESTFPAPADTP